MAGSDYRPLNDKKLLFCIGRHSEKKSLMRGGRL